MIPKILFLIKQIRPTAPQINNLRAPISIFLQPRTLKAIKCVRDALTTTDDTFVLIITEGTFVADADERGGADVAVADRAFAVAFVAETAHGYAGLFAAHDEISGRRGNGLVVVLKEGRARSGMEREGGSLRMMARHGVEDIRYQRRRTPRVPYVTNEGRKR